MIPSGGTSGGVRFCIHTKDTLSAAVDSLFRYHHGKPLCSLNPLPVYHVSGLMPVVRACLTGGCVRMVEWKDLKRGEFSDFPLEPCSLSLVPAQVARLAQSSDGLRFLHGLDTLYIGGAATPPNLLNFIRSEKTAGTFCIWDDRNCRHGGSRHAGRLRFAW